MLTVSVPKSSVAMPPPAPLALLPEKVLLLTVSYTVGVAGDAAALTALLPEKVLLLTVTVP